MYIKQLEVDNFKSFANKVDIPLLQGFTTVSGPNGSGKSALIESILFALGLSTSRTLRSEKLFDFISNLTRRNEAVVKVTLTDGKDGDFSVTRKIKKSSQGYNSIYYLDDKLSSLTDIHLKLENYNITPNSYNIVMQGDVFFIREVRGGIPVSGYAVLQIVQCRIVACLFDIRVVVEIPSCIEERGRPYQFQVSHYVELCVVRMPCGSYRAP